MGRNISQWAKELINEENVKIVIQITPDATNPSASAAGDWVIYSGISVIDGGSI